MMLLPLLSIAATAPQEPTTTALDNAAAEQCQAEFARKLGLNIGSINVTAANHSNGWTILRGSFSGYHRPESPAPGMAAPLHVISLRYTYRCWLWHGSVRRTSAHKTAE